MAIILECLIWDVAHVVLEHTWVHALYIRNVHCYLNVCGFRMLENIHQYSALGLGLHWLRWVGISCAISYVQKSPDSIPSQIMTLEEHIQLVLAANRTVGIIPELKHSTYFNGLKIFKKAKTTNMQQLLRVLDKYGFKGE